MAKIRNNRNICLYCFSDLDEERVCRACGRKETDEPALPHHLARRTVLKKRYLIDHAIGEGGFGITYKAWDLQTSTKVAIKEYYPSGYVSRNPRSNQVVINSKHNYAPSNRGLKRFIDEAKNLSGLKKLNGIVTAHDFFSANNTAYLVMEFLDGISLKKYIKRKGKLDCNTALKILKPVIYSLCEVHAAGLIHRDISPDNILITKTNEVKLIDFGASKNANPEGQSVSIVLKQGFAPEEQYRLHGEQGPWTDVYALAVTVYYCITGQVPPESIQRMYDDTIKKPSALGALITEKQEKALMQALAVFAKDRTHSVSELIEGLYGNDDNLAQTVLRSKLLTGEFTKTHDEPQAKEVESLEKTDSFSEESEADLDEESTVVANEESVESNSYYFPPRDTAVNHQHTPDELKSLLLSEKKIGVAKEKPIPSEPSLGYIPRTKYVERKFSHEDLRKKLLK